MILLIEIKPKQFDMTREKEWVAWGVGMVFAIVATIIYSMCLFRTVPAV